MKTRSFKKLDMTTPNTRLIPVDNVALVISETFNSIPSNRLNKLRFIKALETLNNIIETQEISFDQVSIDINDEFIKILGYYNNDKAFYIEVTKAPIS